MLKLLAACRKLWLGVGKPPRIKPPLHQSNDSISKAITLANQIFLNWRFQIWIHSLPHGWTFLPSYLLKKKFFTRFCLDQHSVQVPNWNIKPVSELCLGNCLAHRKKKKTNPRIFRISIKYNHRTQEDSWSYISISCNLRGGTEAWGTFRSGCTCARYPNRIWQWNCIKSTTQIE